MVAFVGAPHRIDDRGSQALKSLKQIGFDQYYQAEQMGHVLYFEGSTDLSVLLAFARKLGHAAMAVLARPFTHFVGNQPSAARDHFFGLSEAKRDLVGFALFDRMTLPPSDSSGRLREFSWSRREIENYLSQRETLLAWAVDDSHRTGLGLLSEASWRRAMAEAIDEIEAAMTTLGKSPWSPDVKVTDEFLNPLFALFYKKLGLPNLMNKSDYHQLARFVPADEISDEVVTVLDGIVTVARRARPVGD